MATPKHHNKVSVRGRVYPVTGRLTLDGRCYLTLTRFGENAGGKYQVYDPVAGPDGQLRALHVLRDSREARRYVAVLRRITEGNTNLPKLVGYHRRRNYLYLVLTWIDGRSLRSCLDSALTDPRSRFSLVEAFKLFRGLAHGLRHMHHKQNFVHGDIRPENLVLGRSPNRLTLIDFGNAWPVEQTASRSVGDGISEFYQAPEQLCQKPFADFRSDQFALTVVFYEMVALDLPYAGLGGKAGSTQAIRESLEGQLVSVHRQCPGIASMCPRRVWNGIDRIILRGLQLDANRRYPNAREWLNDIEDVYVAIRRYERPSPLEVRLADWLKFMRRFWPTDHPQEA